MIKFSSRIEIQLLKAGLKPTSDRRDSLELTVAIGAINGNEDARYYVHYKCFAFGVTGASETGFGGLPQAIERFKQVADYYGFTLPMGV